MSNYTKISAENECSVDVLNLRGRIPYIVNNNIDPLFIRSVAIMEDDTLYVGTDISHLIKSKYGDELDDISFNYTDDIKHLENELTVYIRVYDMNQIIKKNSHILSVIISDPPVTNNIVLPSPSVDFGKVSKKYNFLEYKFWLNQMWATGRVARKYVPMSLEQFTEGFIKKMIQMDQESGQDTYVETDDHGKVKITSLVYCANCIICDEDNDNPLGTSENFIKQPKKSIIAN